MLTIDNLNKSYEYFYRTLYDEDSFIFKPSDQTNKQGEKFLSSLGSKKSSFTINSLHRYLVFQYLYWKDLSVESFNKRIQFNFVFGSKSLQRYTERNTEYDWQLYEPCKIQKSKIIELFEINTLNEFHNNQIKRRFLNTPEGLAICLEHTTLFDIKDLSCLQCNNQVACKKLLFTNYPSIFKNRGYDPKTVIK